MRPAVIKQLHVYEIVWLCYQRRNSSVSWAIFKREVIINCGSNGIWWLSCIWMCHRYKGFEKFNFISGSLIPQMHPFDGSSSKSIVIMDNCTIHHVPEVVSLFQSVGVWCSFYLCTLQITEMFSYLKSYIRHHDFLIQHLNDSSMITKVFNHLIVKIRSNMLVTINSTDWITDTKRLKINDYWLE